MARGARTGADGPSGGYGPRAEGAGARQGAPAPQGATISQVASGERGTNGPAPTKGARGPTGEQLSGRELEVIALIARGQSNKLIARELDLSPHTVKRHVANALDKLGVASRGQAAAWFHSQPH